ncbi:TDT family transporter [Tepidibacter aestuarii]|uniref:TDT family transporter n=1 Tax=Tepidibacter aestuarii TaxID=2925782 RepID=UPI0020BFB23C|nr:TDT family transporter [Tepidibacter aestuarii]CAH2212728.1 exfoliative toxin A/B [Tepidibacter aestuarii]
MKNIINKLPIPISGLMLALAALGNLVVSYGAIYKNIFGLISFTLLILLILKLILRPHVITESLENPVVASVAPTFSMGLMLLSTYINKYFPSVSFFIWILGLLIHFLLLFYFTKSFIFKFNIKKVFPSYFVVYVGFVVGSVTAPVYNFNNFGQLLFWLGLIFYLSILPIVIYRILYVKNIPEPALPTIAIFAAPANLCLAGYISSFQNKNILIIAFLIVLSLATTFSVLLYMPRLLKLKFYPSYSAFTFPFVISAIAIKKANVFLQNNNYNLSFLKYIVRFEELFAVLIVLYVLIKYIAFLFSNKELSINN